ncbi:MAG TPA: right-handed parallel beta-helix repeat-containing protein [Vicinamibacteria bacterium]
MSLAARAAAALLGLTALPPSATQCGKGPAEDVVVVSVQEFGARGDGQADDTVALQRAVDAVPEAGGRLRFAPGTFRVAGDRGIRLKDNVRVELGEAVLVAPNVDGARNRIFEIQGSRNVVISGGTLVGSRSGSPQWGVGILASDAEDLLIENVTLRDFYFDGILLTGNKGCRRVVVRKVVAENNRRTGLAAPMAFDVTIEQSTFRGSKGQSPQAGVNFEPNAEGEVRNIRLINNTFSGNAGVGLYIHRGLGVGVFEATVQANVVENNDQGIVASGVDGVTIAGNRVRGHVNRARSGIALGEGTRRAAVVANELEGNFRGIIAAGATQVEIRDNRVTGTGLAAAPATGDDGDGIVCRGLRAVLPDACAITGNTVRRSAGSGIVAQLVSGVQIRDNTVEESGQRGVFAAASLNGEVTGNHVAGTGQERPKGFDAIELAQSANDNLIAHNVVQLAPATREAIGIGPGCRGNRVFGNVVVPE